MKRNSYNKISYFLIGFIIWLLISPCNSQSVNIDYFHGMPTVVYPICNVKSGDLSLPVNLIYSPVDIWKDNYISNDYWLGEGWPYDYDYSTVTRSNSNRVPVNPQAYHPGNFGIGWELSAGGKITRTIKDLPDEINGDDTKLTPYGGYYHRYGNLHTPYTTDPMLQNVDMKELAGKYDSESDEFSFNFNGISGYFYYLWGKWVVVSESDISIDVKLENVVGQELDIVINTITITTPDGNRYTFGENDAKEYTSFTSNSLPSCITGWGLTKVESPKGDIITLTYDKDQLYYPLLNQCKVSSSEVDEDLYSTVNLESLSYSPISTSPTDDEIKRFSKGQTVDKLILKNIVSESCNVTLKKTSCIPFKYPKEPQNTVSGSVGFFKIDNITVYENNSNNRYYEYKINYERTQETLYLKDIQKTVSQANETAEMPKSEFEYYPAEIFLAPTALKSIKYSSGGSSEFVYENMDFAYQRYRIQSHKIKSGTNDKATLYKYHYGTLNYEKKDFSEVPGTLNRDSEKKRILYAGKFWDKVLQKEMIYLTRIENTLYGCDLPEESSFPLRPKNEITYNNVCEELLGEGDNQTYSRIGITTYSFNGYYDSVGKVNDEFLIGKLYLTEILDKNFFGFKSREIIYKPAKKELVSLYSFMNLNFHFISSDGMQNISTYPKLSELNIKATKYLIENEYIVESSAIYNYNYEYNSLNQVSQKEIVENRYKTTMNGGEPEYNTCNTTISYKYVNEFDIPDENGESVPSIQLENKIIKNLPVEIITRKNGKITGAQYTHYKTLPSTNQYSSDRFYVPYKTYKLLLQSPIENSEYTPVSADFKTKDNHYVLDRTYDLYDEYGNVLQYKDNGRPVVSFQYEKIYGSWLPVIKGENYEHTALFLSPNDIRKNNPQAFITEFIYNNSGKMLQQTNPDGKKVSYEYDIWDRLKYIKDTNGNIIEAKSYFNSAIK